jgi:hypothetical protein
METVDTTSQVCPRLGKSLRAIAMKKSRRRADKYDLGPKARSAHLKPHFLFGATTACFNTRSKQPNSNTGAAAAFGALARTPGSGHTKTVPRQGPAALLSERVSDTKLQGILVVW